MKILVLHNDLRVYWKGRLLYLRNFLQKKGIDFYAVELFGKGSPYFFDDFDTANQWWTCLFPDHSDKELSRKQIKEKLFARLDEIKPDIIIGGSVAFYSGALGMRWAKKNKSKFVMFDDAKPSQIKRNFIVQYVKDTLIRQIDGMWLPSKEYDKDYAFLGNDKTIFYGYNTIDNKQFAYKAEKTFDTKVLISVARLVELKNFDNLLRSWKIVEQRNTGYKLVIIGDGPERASLHQLADELKLDTVEFLGVVDYTCMNDYFYHADAFVLASWWESWAMVVNEAMAASLPVLLSNNINAGRTLLKEGINGFSYPPDDVNQMAAAMLKFIELPVEEKKKMSKNSLATIDTMSYEVMGEELLRGVAALTQTKPKRKAILPTLLINLWDGRYNTEAWNIKPKM